MNNKNKCLCASKTAKFCCPTDKKLRKTWLMDLEKEYLRIKYKNSISGRS